MTSLSTPWDVVIVGGGAAGLSAALILARARRRILVLDGDEPRNRFAPHMHGVLSRDGYSPLDLVADGRREVRAVDGVIESARVVSVTRQGNGTFELETERGERFQSSRLIVATGVSDRLPDIPGLAEQWGRGAVSCPYCDGYEARDKRVGVLLGTQAGQHKAQMLRAYTPEVTVLAGLVGTLPDDDLRALAARGIGVDTREIASVVSEGDRLTGVQFVDGASLDLEVLFVESVIAPHDELLRQLGAERTESPFGSWTVTDATFRTSIPGVFAIGNVANPAALVPVAMGAGVVAATTINSELIAADVAAALAS